MQQRMTITLNQAAIEAALIAYVAEMGVAIAGKETEVSMTAGRKDNGYSADVTIISETSPKVKSVSKYQPELTPLVEEVVEEEVIIEDTMETSDPEEAISEEEEVITKPTKKAANLFGN